MDAPRPIIKRLRIYWLAYCIVTLAETACIAYLLFRLAGISWTICATAWLLFRISIRPTGDQARALVGRGQMRRYPSVTLVGLLVIAVLSVNLWLDRGLADTLTLIAGPRTNAIPAAVPVSPHAAPSSTPADWLVQLRAFADQLDVEARDLKRQLPRHAQALRAALEAAEQAVAAANAGDEIQSRAWQQTVADQLTEFAREASDSPRLRGYVEIATALAGAYAEAAKRPTSDDHRTNDLRNATGS